MRPSSPNKTVNNPHDFDKYELVNLKFEDDAVDDNICRSRAVTPITPSDGRKAVDLDTLPRLRSRRPQPSFSRSEGALPVKPFEDDSMVDEDALLLQLLALLHTKREATRLFMMAARQGATDAQIVDALRLGLPHLTDPCVDDFEAPSVADRRRRNAIRIEACASDGFGRIDACASDGFASPGLHKCMGDSELSVIYNNNGKPTIDRNFFKSLAKTIKANRALIPGDERDGPVRNLKRTDTW